MFKAVCLDLDGTLLDDEKKISDRSFLLLDNLIENGIEVIIATGRHFYMVSDFLRPLKRDIMVCANNGAMSRFKESNKLVNVEYVSNSKFLEIYNKALECGMNPYIYVDSFVDGYHLAIKDGQPKKSHFEENIVDKKIAVDSVRYFSQIDVESLETVLCIAFLDKEERIDEFFEYFKDEEDLVKNMYFVPNGKKVLEFQSKKADKWIAITNYLKSKNISLSEVVSFGDEFNDKSMVKNSGMGFAMKNGIEELKSLTNNITEFTNNEDGVYFELKKIFKDIIGE
ncbi:Cof-type HAD-IIB family hydrolase [uncultured Parvimonas sp.]|jgi:cof-like hydrolase|uniref:Cof-type HAD-IIB family hydrolase n=1 Tax=uncultured Parvimonas sp. TaxID=747372 RepID=UPI0028D33608|nr:Cof-type HAD-IIB family hydrolase [uncultured Parvimonas sp.]